MDLRIEAVSVTYPGGVQALRDVSPSIGPGVFGRLGPNGAGKTTLMRIVATLQEPQAGTVSFAGIDVLRQRREVRQRLGYLPQEFGLDPRLSAGDFLDHLLRRELTVDGPLAELTVEVGGRPERVALDPTATLLERDLDDNAIAVAGP